MLKNKKLITSVQFDFETDRKLGVIAQHKSNQRSKAAQVKFMIDAEYDRLFPEASTTEALYVEPIEVA